MKTNRDGRIETGGSAQSILNCGGKPSATPPFPQTGTEGNEENEGGVLRYLRFLLLDTSVPKRRRRCASSFSMLRRDSLPAQSKTWRRVGARNLFRFIVRPRRAFENALAPAPFETRSGLKSALLKAMAAVLVCSASARAQTYSIDWYTIDGGGGTSTGGVYSVAGTVGQPDAGTMSGGSYSLAGGFWGIISAIQTPGAPLLTIRLTQTNTVVVSWPSPSAGFGVQQNADLNTANWTTPPESITDNGTNKFIVVNPPLGNRFYRLFKP